MSFLSFLSTLSRIQVKGKGTSEKDIYDNPSVENVPSGENSGVAGEKSELGTQISSILDNSRSASAKIPFIGVKICQKEVNSAAVGIAGDERFSKVVKRYSKCSRDGQNIKLFGFILSVVSKVCLEQQLSVKQLTPEIILHTLLLGNHDETYAIIPLPDLTCLTLCRTYSLEEMARDYGYAKDAKMDIVEDRELLRTASPFYRPARENDVLVDEQDLLRPFFEPVDVVIAKSLPTLCRQMNAVWEIQLTASVLKGIVTDGQSMCQLVLLVENSTEPFFMGTPPVSTPKDMAAFLILALLYSGRTLQTLLTEWDAVSGGEVAARMAKTTVEKGWKVKGEEDEYDDF